MENTRLVARLRKKQLSLEKANREIKLLSRTDSLTGCYNRGYLNELLPREITRALRYKRPLALAMCDIDKFKKINDTYGHQCGDEILKKLVQRISEVIRADTDWLARYGGEEFLIVLPETQLENASGARASASTTSISRRRPLFATCSGPRTWRKGFARISLKTQSRHKKIKYRSRPVLV